MGAERTPVRLAPNDPFPPEADLYLGAPSV